MGDLTEFLLARIAEDEEAAREELSMPKRGGVLDWSWRDVMTRMLAECAAKRAIVGRCSAAIKNDPHDIDDPEWVAEVIDSLTFAHLYDLAAVYADHPDYRDEWRS